MPRSYSVLFFVLKQIFDYAPAMFSRMKRIFLFVFLLLSTVFAVINSFAQAPISSADFDIRAGAKPRRTPVFIDSKRESSTAQKPESIAQNFINRNSTAELELIREDLTNQMTHLSFRQKVNGVEIFQPPIRVHLNAAGDVIAADGALLENASRLIDGTKVKINSAQAQRIAAEKNGIAFKNSNATESSTEARLIYFPLSDDRLIPAWEQIIWATETPDAYYILVDAERGTILFRRNLTSYESDPHGLVFNAESPRPNNPSTTNQPVVIDRSDLVFNGSLSFPMSDPHFNWWAGAVPDSLISNNADAHLDRNNDNLPDLPTLKIPNLNFSFALDFSKAATDSENQKAAQVNLFYWTNRFHDILYNYGFTESAGNFQANNFNFGGKGNDAIQAEAQDGSGVNNANFTTPPDGRTGRVQMFLWNGSPQLDGSFDQSVILHELTHGVSGRLIGDGLGLGGMQARGLGEGWSDFVALTLMRKSSDPIDGAYLLAQYATSNYSRGLRQFPYSTDINISPMTFGRIFTNPTPHSVGEIWCATLWDLRALLIKKYGFDEGQKQSLQLVIDGMKLTPVEPNFLEARDAILLADKVNNNGSNQCLLWQAFAKRGLGFSAKTLDTNDRRPTESFDAAPFCSDFATLKLDQNNYVNGEMMNITLADRNAKAPAKVAVKSSITNDNEEILLTADTAQVGVFRGALKISESRAANNDGALQASTNLQDRLIVSYQDADSASPITAQASVSREQILFSDNIERGNQGWGGKWAITNSANSSHSWTDSPFGNYADKSEASLISPSFDLTKYSDVYLLISHRFEFENRYDYGYVEYSVDGGMNWIYAASFTGSQLNFTQATINVHGLSNQANARFRFRVLSDEAVNADGWYVDDIQLIGRSSDPTVISPNSIDGPVITGVSPAFGASTGGAKITISGSGFTADTKLSFGNVAASTLKIVSNATITATAPPHSVGAVPLIISNRNGGSSLNNGFTYWDGNSSNALTKFSQIFPASGSLRGGVSVRVFGENFTPDVKLTLDAKPVETEFINANELRFIAPASDKSGRVNLIISGASSQLVVFNAFNYVTSTPPIVKILSQFEVINSGASVGISWQSSGDTFVSKQRIELLNSDGTVAQVIASEIGGETQSFVWKVPLNFSAPNVRLRLSATDSEGNSSSTESANFEIRQRWKTEPKISVMNWQFPMVSDGKNLFAMGGIAQGSTVNTAFRYDSASGAWVSLAAMPLAVSGTEAALLNGKIYVPGGVLESSLVITNLQLYDIASNSWSQKLEAPIAAQWFALATDADNGMIYRIGGSRRNVTAPISDLLMYDTKANSWEQLPEMPEPRYGHEAVFMNGKILIAGGANRSGGLTRCWQYDVKTGLWSQIAPMNRARRFAASGLGSDVSGRPFWFIFGGDDPNSSQPLADGEAYDIENNRWISLDESFNFSAGKTSAATAIINSKLYVAGGATLPANSPSFVVSDGVESIDIKAVAIRNIDAPPSLSAPSTLIGFVGKEIIANVSANNFGASTAMTLTASELPERAEFRTTPISNNKVNGSLKWTPNPIDVGKQFTVNFSVTNGQFTDTKAMNLRVVNAASIVTVNAANYYGGALASDAIASVFGAKLSPRIESAQALPLPLEMAGTSITVNGFVAQLLYVSSDQINFVLPKNLAAGTATIIVKNIYGEYSMGTVTIAASTPGIFTRDSSGRGEASATATADGIHTQMSPFSLTVNGRPNYLSLFGTGIRGAAATNPDDENGVAESVTATIGGVAARVLYAGAQGFFVGVDQINLELPQALSNRINPGVNQFEVVISVNGIEANRVVVSISK